MFQNIKSIFKQSALYGIGTALTRLTGFILIPVYARYITPSDYGVLAIFYLMTAIMIIFYGMGIGQAFFRFYYDCKDDNEKKELMGTVIIFLFIVSIILSIILLLCESWVLTIIFGSAQYKYHFKLVIVTVITEILANCQLRLYRTQNKPAKFIFFSFLKFILAMVFTILFVVFYKRSFLGVLEGAALSSIISYFFIAIAQVKDIRIAFLSPKIKEMIKYGIPFIPASLCSFALMSSDRYLISIFSDYTEVGLYSMAYKFGVFINVFIITPFNLAWPTQIISISKKENANEIFAKIMTYFVLIMVSCNVLFSVFIKNIYELLLTPEYFSSYKVVPFILYSYVFHGMYTVGVVSMFLTKQTRPQAKIFALAAAINFILNLIFIPIWGMLGAAISTLLSYLTIPIMTNYYAQKLYKVDYEFLRITKIFITSVIIISIGYIVDDIPAFNNILFKIFLLIMFPVLLFMSRFFEAREINKIKMIFNSAYRRS